MPLLSNNYKWDIINSPMNGRRLLEYGSKYVCFYVIKISLKIFTTLPELNISTLWNQMGKGTALSKKSFKLHFYKWIVWDVNIFLFNLEFLSFVHYNFNWLIKNLQKFR